MEYNIQAMLILSYHIHTVISVISFPLNKLTRLNAFYMSRSGLHTIYPHH